VNWNSLTKQYKTGLGIGTLKAQISNTLFYVNTVQFFINLGMAYHTTYGEILIRWFPWINFFLVALILTIGFCFVGLLDYKIALPSSMAFANQQGMKHNNPYIPYFDEMIANDKRNEKRLKRIEKKLGIKDD
jgi:hypothetical protein